MSHALTLHPDRLFPADEATRSIARALYAGVKDLPIVSPHGHTDPRWYAENEPFPDPSTLFIVPDHYVFRMLYSQGIALEALGVPRRDGGATEQDSRKIWQLFAANQHLFRGTPSAMWLAHAFHEVFGIRERLTPENADAIYDRIDAQLKLPEFLPRALYERFNIEVIATTESPLDDLKWHKQIRESGWKGRVLTAYRPDPVVDPDFPGFAENLVTLGRDYRPGHHDLAGLSGGAAAAARLFPRGRRLHLDRSRPPDRRHGRPVAQGRVRPVRRRSRRAALPRMRPNCSAVRC
jgi:glucuronate isomerase